MKLPIGKRCICLLLCLALLAPGAAVRADETDEAAYRALLAERGFPASYLSALWALHERYPQWDFQPMAAALTWEEALAAESVLGVSLVQGSSPTSWKSTQAGAFNWATSTYVTLDSGGWVAASREIIAYYMDPRNFLTEDAVFQFLYLGYDGSLQTKEGLLAMAEGTYLADTTLDLDGDETNGVTTYADVLCAAGEQNGLNPYMLASVLIQEQGRSGAGESISGGNARFPGYYNYFNIGAYKTPEYSAVERGLWYASGGNSGAVSYGRPWNSRSGAILGGAAFYAANYQQKGQTTLYLKRFNVQGEECGTHQYMTSVSGAWAEGRTLAEAYTAPLRAAALVFHIPVYADMPETACPLPQGDGAVNAKLASLAVSGVTLTPEFSRDVTEYTAVVPAELTEVSVTATACDRSTAIDGLGVHKLEAASDTLYITVTAPSGTQETYRLLLSRQETPTAPETDPPAATEPPEATPPPVYARGDVDGDGSVRINDLIRLRNHLLNTQPLTGPALAAADVDGDGSVLINDLIRLRNHLLGTAVIS